MPWSRAPGRCVMADLVEPAVRQVSELARARVASGSPTPVTVAIDGRSGAGKTSFAARVAAQLPQCALVHLDDFYPGWDGMARTPDLLAEWLLRPIRDHAPAGYRRFDWQLGEFAEWVPVAAGTFLVIEGAGSSVEPAGGYADLRVWLEAPATLRKARALARDGDTYAPHWDRWAAQEDTVFRADRTRQRADLVIETG